MHTKSRPGMCEKRKEKMKVSPLVKSSAKGGSWMLAPVPLSGMRSSGQTLLRQHMKVCCALTSRA